ncbi:NAD-binding protein [Leptolyngbya sp. FACHB-261]|uniref:potassium channel family protein n=1 Tax=Leptolyngbya sp. FACHB-261 TaxID=2692806 RepID=UPI001689A806|nr:NAD-binding protein [Leptolyngbya sp. FACHB-261]MBD2103875.1 NAD-binding protein [Leptolyngbya sp. FACHB-261]
MEPRIIVCGLGHLGQSILQLLKAQNIAVAGITRNPPRDLGLGLDLSQVRVGDYQSAEVLLSVGIQHAQTLVLAGSDDAINLRTLMQARILNPSLRIVNRLFNPGLGQRLDQTLSGHLSMSVSALAAPAFVFSILGNEAIGQLKLFGQTWPIHEVEIDEDHAWRGKTLRELWDDRTRMLVDYLPAGSQQNLVYSVLQGRRMRPGDRVIVGIQPETRNVRSSLRLQLRRAATSLAQLSTNQSQGLMWGMVALLATILLATLVYASSVLRVSPLDALYFAVGLITGAVVTDIGVATAPALLKLFTILTMLVGAAIIGVFYTLLNDFVLGARLNHVLEAARIPRKGHYIVCGLGGVGWQIVHQLHQQGHDVVVIERDERNRFLSSVRSLRIPVIQADANLGPTLQTANIQGADGLLAVTSDDTVNLEIALSARSLVSTLPIVVRSQTPRFSHMMQQVFHFTKVLNPVELTAPSFVSAALGGRILGSGMTVDGLWLAAAIVITPEHPFCNLQIQSAAIAVDFVPLYLDRPSRLVHGWDLLDAVLEAGDTLYLTIPASRLEHLQPGSLSLLSLSELNSGRTGRA